MKKLVFAAMATLAMMSCSKDETTSVKTDGAISFRPSVGMITRATTTTTSTLESFFVTALDKDNADYFTNVEFRKSGTTFNSTPAYNWPTDGSNLSFIAYAPSETELGGTLTITGSTKTLADYQPAATISDQKDFITANATGSKTNEETGVALAFKHALSQIEIRAKNNNTGYVYKVQGIRIGKPASKGTYDFGTGAWTPNTEKLNYEDTYTTEKTLAPDAASLMKIENDNAMLIPQQLTAWNPGTDKPNISNGAYLAVKVNITTKAGAQVYPAAAGTYGWAAVAIDTKWESGKKYIYTLDFSDGAGKVDPEKPTPVDPSVDPFKPGEDILGGKIKFTVTVDEWTEVATPVAM